MKLPNQRIKSGVVRAHTLKIFTLMLAMSLTALSPQPTLALNICDVDPRSEACITSQVSSYQVVVNKSRPLNPKSYRPVDLVRIRKYNPLGLTVRKQVAAAIVKLGNQMAIEKKGTLIVRSGFRSYASQKTIYHSKIRALGKVKGENLAARAGYSEHQTGLAVDLTAVGAPSIQISFAKSVPGKWLAKNAYKFGFVLRYPLGKTQITGYQFEPWHFRYVGVDVATAMHNQNTLTLEEFYALPAAPGYLN